MNNQRHASTNVLSRLILALATCMVLPLSAGQKPPEFYFGGQRLTLGMPVSNVAALLSTCCVLTPPLGTSDSGAGGHFIRTKDGPPYRLLGSISFRDGKVSLISRRIDSDFDGENDEAVHLARALYRALAPTIGDSSSSILVSVQHMRLGNGEGDTLSLSFPNGRGIELQIVTLDSPSKFTGKRDSVTLEEILEPPR